MTELEPYKIAGVETLNIELGSLQLPKSYKITYGERDTRSLIFHCKIFNEYHKYTINHINFHAVAVRNSVRRRCGSLRYILSFNSFSIKKTVYLNARKACF